MLTQAPKGTQDVLPQDSYRWQTIEDAMRHLLHAIEVMGIDHVGLGTDFDGDGGICGLANSAELLQFTRQLLSRHFTEEDIRKIWGGNFLRVMQQVQDMKR